MNTEKALEIMREAVELCPGAEWGSAGSYLANRVAELQFKLDHILECEETNGLLDAFLCELEQKKKALARVKDVEEKNKQLREEVAGLLAAADADAFIIDNLNARVIALAGDILSEDHVQIETTAASMAHACTSTGDSCRELARLRDSCTD